MGNRTADGCTLWLCQLVSQQPQQSGKTYITLQRNWMGLGAMHCKGYTQHNSEEESNQNYVYNNISSSLKINHKSVLPVLCCCLAGLTMKVRIRFFSFFVFLFVVIHFFLLFSYSSRLYVFFFFTLCKLFFPKHSIIRLVSNAGCSPLHMKRESEWMMNS